MTLESQIAAMCRPLLPIAQEWGIEKEWTRLINEGSQGACDSAHRAALMSMRPLKAEYGRVLHNPGATEGELNKACDAWAKSFVLGHLSAVAYNLECSLNNGHPEGIKHFLHKAQLYANIASSSLKED